jgi:hypothetical protein
MLLGTYIWGCDACASFSNSVNLGLTPLLRNNMVTTRYNLTRFNTIPFAFSEATNSEITHSWDIQGRFRINRRLQISTAIPYNFFKQSGDFGKVNLYGLGDLSIVSSLILINSSQDKEKKVNHLLFINGGLKLPTGKTSIQDDTGRRFNPRMQPGSGSIDYILGMNYIVKYGNNSFLFETSGRLNTMNDQSYQMGNLFRSVVRYSRWYKIDDNNLLLNLGLTREEVGDDYSKSDLFHAMHGRKEYGIQCGADLFFKKVVFNINYQMPFYKIERQNAINTLYGLSLGLGTSF